MSDPGREKEQKKLDLVSQTFFGAKSGGAAVTPNMKGQFVLLLLPPQLKANAFPGIIFSFLTALIFASPPPHPISHIPYAYASEKRVFTFQWPSHPGAKVSLGVK